MGFALPSLRQRGTRCSGTRFPWRPFSRYLLRLLLLCGPIVRRQTGSGRYSFRCPGIHRLRNLGSRHVHRRPAQRMVGLGKQAQRRFDRLACGLVLPCHYGWSRACRFPSYFQGEGNGLSGSGGRVFRKFPKPVRRKESPPSVRCRVPDFGGRPDDRSFAGALRGRWNGSRSC